MPSFYTYLISSLPMLHFGIRPPFSFEKFISICQGHIPEKEIDILKAISKGYSYIATQPILKTWLAFDTALRNELVKIRASRKHIDPLKYVRGDEYVQPYIASIAMNVYRNPSILEAQRTLDEARWEMLDELSIGHYFDFDFLIIYSLKLLILKRWERINSVDRPRILEETLAQIQ